jgi:hypothetical protein
MQGNTESIGKILPKFWLVSGYGKAQRTPLSQDFVDARRSVPANTGNR